MRRVIFLDFDGVLIHELSAKRHYEARQVKSPRLKAEILEDSPSVMDADCVSRLLELQKKHGFKVVVSSSLRRHYQNKAELVAEYKCVGFDELDIHDDWRTPSSTKTYDGDGLDLAYWCKKSGIPFVKSLTNRWRGHEIMEWLEKHPEVDQWLAIDDTPHFYPLKPANCLYLHAGNYHGGLAHWFPDNVDAKFAEVFADV
jgi:hypothetical protein